ncbi:MAG: molybdopterin molybdotransferase MoeA [Gammaproteobacteria bacterium]|nr:molybdopterin molybdotransferase MoeA [Gammaproteobacteria bacterium]
MSNSPWLSLSDAIAAMLSQTQPVSVSEKADVKTAVGRVLATPVVASINVPPCNNSAMDGYALKSGDGQAGNTLEVVGAVFAGDSQSPTVLPGQCVRIMTGAPIPTDCDAVIIQENVSREHDTITLQTDTAPLANIRETGSDIARGDQLFDAGHRLTATDTMLLSSLGLASVDVYRQLTIGLLATGDELVEAGNPLATGQIYESNRTGVAALLQNWQVQINNLGIVADKPETLKQVLQEAQQTCDVIISSGGVSVGDADFVKPVLDELGEIGFWKVAIKPGKPFAFGRLGNAVFCGLPGNPVSACVTTEQLVVPVIRHLQGETGLGNGHRLTLKAQVTRDIKRRAGRLDFQRAVFSQNPAGMLIVTPLAKQSSGVMTSFSQANCYMLIPAEADGLKTGDWVEIQPFSVTGKLG